MSLDSYKVFNLIEDVTELKVLLILESPHINEYIHQHPAAGESALELTKFLVSQGYLANFDEQLPLGCNIKTLHYKPLGIINCSTLPMNKTFYPCSLAADDLSKINNLTIVKQHLAQNGLDTGREEQHTARRILEDEFTSEAVFKDFTIRLTQVLEQASPHIIIVPCGDTATGFINAFKATYNQPLTVLDSLPHPTESDWDEKIKELTIIDRVPIEMLP